MIWRFSDGTTVELGGNVEGPTLLAQRLRQQIASGSELVSIWPPPGGDVPLDTSDAAILDAWLGRELDYLRRVRGLNISLARPSNVPPLPPAPNSSSSEPGTIY